MPGPLSATTIIEQLRRAVALDRRIRLRRRRRTRTRCGRFRRPRSRSASVAAGRSRAAPAIWRARWRASDDVVFADERDPQQSAASSRPPREHDDRRSSRLARGNRDTARRRSAPGVPRARPGIAVERPVEPRSVGMQDQQSLAGDTDSELAECARRWPSRAVVRHHVADLAVGDHGGGDVADAGKAHDARAGRPAPPPAAPRVGGARRGSPDSPTQSAVGIGEERSIAAAAAARRLRAVPEPSTTSSGVPPVHLSAQASPQTCSPG